MRSPAKVGAGNGASLQSATPFCLQKVKSLTFSWGWSGEGVRDWRRLEWWMKTRRLSVWLPTRNKHGSLLIRHRDKEKQRLYCIFSSLAKTHAAVCFGCKASIVYVIAKDAEKVSRTWQIFIFPAVSNSLFAFEHFYYIFHPAVWEGQKIRATQGWAMM